jgi:hypothetical protein
MLLYNETEKKRMKWMIVCLTKLCDSMPYGKRFANTVSCFQLVNVNRENFDFNHPPHIIHIKTEIWDVVMQSN